MRTYIVAGLCSIAVPVLIWGQIRKAGLWELTTQTRMESAAVISGNGVHPPHTMQVCLTQEQVDKYGAFVPPIPGCHVTKVVKKPGGMSGEMVCAGRMTGTATLESTSEDGIHAKGSIHFSGTLLAGATAKPMEWSSETIGVFKGSDCGKVKPSVIQDK